MRRNLRRLLAGAFMFTLSAVAWADTSPLVGIYNADNVLLWPGLLTWPQCGNGCAFHPMGVIYTITASAGTATGTGEQILGTYSLPANALDQAGRRLRIRAQFSTAANTNSKTAKLYFGGTALSSGAVTTSAGGVFLELTVLRTTASHQIVTERGQVITTALAVASAATTETDTGAIVIKATCQDGTSSANDCVLQDFAVEYMN